jgi:xanthine dehydrogenase accessory factor
MMLMRDLLAELNSTIDRRNDCVWCTVAATRGSTPQKPGAAMLVFADGTQSGTLGGGCVEAEVRRRALHALSNGNGPNVHEFVLDDDFGWDDGLICGGRMTIVAHPLRSESADAINSADYYGSLHSLAEAGEGFTEAVVLADGDGLKAGDRYLFDAKGAQVAQLAERPNPESIAQRLPPLAERPRPNTIGSVAYLPTLPTITLLLVGGGHVSRAVAELASQVEFDIWVLDDRERYANRERFPTASRHVVGEIGPALRDLVPQLNSSAYALVLTRGHSHDEEALFHLASSRCGFIGMIGSKRKNRLIFDDLIHRGISEELLSTVHAPLGIDIGSQTVHEIAISIVAELIAHRNAGVRKKRGCPE